MSRPTARQTIQAIVNIFETGSLAGDYARVAVLQGDAGHLSYGRSQTTLGSGNLFFLIRGYCEQPDAMHAPALRGYLDALEACDLHLDDDRVLHGLLRDTGEDVVMRSARDAYFAPILDTIGARPRRRAS